MSSIFLKPLFEKKVDPVTAIVRDVFKDNNYALSCLGALSLGLGVSHANNLVAQDDIEEVIVTASKKEQNIQDVAMSVQAISAAELEKKNIKSLEDIANLSPAVTFNNVGPGKSDFYIRGVSDGSIMNSYAGAEATTALYLDEQPLTAASLTPDIHVYDVERVEVLLGPQGTLYGSSSTSGNIKIITKKPDPSSIDYGFDVEYGSITDGATDDSLEAFVNIPIGSNLAARFSTYEVNNGGWIDNQRATFTYSLSGYTIDNYTAPYNVAKDDYNEEEKEGSRLRISTNNDNVNLDLSFLTQTSSYSGSYEADETTDDLLTKMAPRTNTRFTPEQYDDEFDQISMSITGNINDDMSFILTSSIFERETSYTYDYSSYVEYYYGAGSPYYVCDYYDYYYYGIASNCQDPRMSYAQSNDIERTATEFRVQSNNEDSGFQWILGAFTETDKKLTDVDYLQPGGYPIYWEADLQRKGEKEAVFGEATIDITDKTTLIMGFRDYSSDMDLTAADGYYGSYGYGINATNFKNSESGFIPKINVAHDITDDIMVYANITEGFRPSGVNRARPSDTTVPKVYDADYLESMEIGFKSKWMDGKLTANGAYYTMDWSDYQSLIFDSTRSSAAFVQNVSDAEIRGLELNLIYNLNDTSTVTAYINSMDPTLVEDFYSEGVLNASSGNRLSYMPELTYYLSFDKDFTLMGKPAFANLDYSYNGDRRNDIANDSVLLPSYALANFRMGVENTNSVVELYITNITDEDGYLSRYNDFDDTANPPAQGFGIRQTRTKPRVIGIRYRYRY